MTERPGGLPEDAPLPAHLDPRGRGSRRVRPTPEPPDSTEPPGVPRPGGPAQRRRRGSALRRLALGLVALLVLLAVGSAAALLYFDRQIARVPVTGLGTGPDVDGGDVNVLLVGSDSRQGLSQQELEEVRTGVKGGGNETALTDTVVLVHLPGDGGEPVLVSLPRDSFVEIPGHDRGRLNTAYALGQTGGDGGGPSLLVETVQQLSGLRIDHYLEVGFIAFVRITDALGGVEVDLCAPAQDVKAGIDLPAGQQRLAGGDALGFVRQRDGLPRGDLDRIARQQYFLGSVARQVLSPGTLLRPDRLLRVADAITSSITADQDLSSLDLLQLGLRMRGAASGGLAFQTVPVADPDARVGGASVVRLDEPALPGFFASLSPGTGSALTPPPAVPIAPSSIRLAVLNGTTRAGLAGQAGQALEGQGYTVTRTGNADQGPVGRSLVLHGAGRADSARSVAASVPGAEVRQDDSVGANGLVLVVGDDYDGVRTVTVATPAPAPSPQDVAPAPAPQVPTERPCIT